MPLVALRAEERNIAARASLSEVPVQGSKMRHMIAGAVWQLAQTPIYRVEGQLRSRSTTTAPSTNSMSA